MRGLLLWGCLNERNYMLPYTYLIKCPNGKQYYGYRYANEVPPNEDLWKVYFTSSKLIKELREQYNDDSQFVAIVDKVFETAADARAYEEKYLTENNCVESDDWLNRVNYGHKWHYRPETEEEHLAASERLKKYYEENPHPWTGRNHSKETIEKIRATKTGTKATEETKRKKSIAVTGENNPMYGRKQSEETKRKIATKAKGNKHWLGKHHTEETKRKMKGHPVSEETKRKISESHKRRHAAIKAKSSKATNTLEKFIKE
jgi:hypothetical protein